MPESILDGVNTAIDRAFGLSGGRLRYDHKEQSQRFSKAPKTDLDAQQLIRDMLATIEKNWHGGKSRSKENWRWKKNTAIDPKNASPEVVLERWIARTTGDDWVNQVPVASGLTASAGGRRAIDLVHRCGKGWYEFIELKVEHGGTPLFAAMEILQYGALYMFSRANAQTLANVSADGGMFNAAGIHLKVLAPAAYYAGYDLAWLEKRINQGLARHVAEARCGFKMDFAFESLSVIPSGSPIAWGARTPQRAKR